ncbi:NACHT and WD repeat domain-containing protein [Asticcacaulis benevestitus]|uniref:NACHT and WD repeat domain-containing protein n=1 Tax=Asticcacaulis benevestitus TaxID=347481 RepID=UPI000AFFCAD0|nr:AAA family ATPase [Asticcacaulis benevestitus]
MKSFQNPPGYPKDGTYADLLFWHLEVWRTRPDGSISKRGELPWDEKSFLTELYKDSKNTESEGKIFRNWIGETDGGAPNSVNASKVADALFGENWKNSIFEPWGNDLGEARKRSGKGKNSRTITLDAAVAELAAAGYLSVVISTNAHQVRIDRPHRTHIASATSHDVNRITKALLKGGVYGRASELATVDKFVESRMRGENDGLLVITAPAGFGKSALAAEWCCRNITVSKYRVAKHFCSVSYPHTTTSLNDIHAHLRKQIADIYGDQIDLSRDRDALVDLLELEPPNGQKLVVWLDGIDEARETVPFFLPEVLGKNVCVIVSARADEGVTPAYLAPWFPDPKAPLPRHDLLKLTLLGVEELVGGLFQANGLALPDGLGLRIFNSSEQGYTLFARIMTDDAIEAVKKDKIIDLGEAPESLFGYAKRQLEKLEAMKEWPEIQPLFAFLTIAREAVRVDEFPELIDRSVFPKLLPHQVSRWFTHVVDDQRIRPELLSFAHQKLSEVFGRALGTERRDAIRKLCANIAKKSYDEWPTYAWRHLPRHLLDLGHKHDAVNYLANERFISARFKALGEELAPAIMAADWRSWLLWGLRTNFESDAQINLLRHLRLWAIHSQTLKELATQKSFGHWRQLMQDVALIKKTEITGLIHPQSKFLPTSLTGIDRHGEFAKGIELNDGGGFLSWNRDCTLQIWKPKDKEGLELGKHENKISGALALKGAMGFISWDMNGVLRLWGASGEIKAVMHSQEEWIDGVLQLENSAGFLSWCNYGALRLWSAAGKQIRAMRSPESYISNVRILSNNKGFVAWGYDGTIQIWSGAGRKKPLLYAHIGGVHGVLVLEDGKGFLSWGADCALQLWGVTGKEGPTMLGHEDRILGVLELENGTGFLSWSANGTLRLWGRKGEQGVDMCGHTDSVLGALVLENGAGFLSWSLDGTLRLWGPKGEEGVEMCGHTDSVLGALVLENGGGFLSWSLDGTLRLWGQKGEEGVEMRGHADSVLGILVLENGTGFLSWSADGTLRLWNTTGKLLNLWLSPNGTITNVVRHGASDHYLVLFGKHIDIVHLPNKPMFQ